jgi:hypothetical protein
MQHGLRTQFSWKRKQFPFYIFSPVAGIAHTNDLDIGLHKSKNIQTEI